MNITLEYIRREAERCPNMRIKTLVHKLEKQAKTEELRKAEAKQEPRPVSWFDRMMGRS